MITITTKQQHLEQQHLEQQHLEQQLGARGNGQPGKEGGRKNSGRRHGETTAKVREGGGPRLRSLRSLRRGVEDSV